MKNIIGFASLNPTSSGTGALTSDEGQAPADPFAGLNPTSSGTGALTLDLSLLKAVGKAVLILLLLELAL